MKFLTEVKIEKLSKPIEHNHSILTIGSCFAENIGAYFTKYKFNALVNPFGVLYNSASIKNSIELAIKKKKYSKDELIFDQDEWHSFYHHSDFSNHEQDKVLEKINFVSEGVYNFLNKVDWIIVSLGTSFVYRHKARNIIVSNCHKIPQNQFSKEILSIDQNVENLTEVIQLIRNISTDSRFILTVSPIRHWKDGAHQNQLSKAVLHLAIDKLVRNNPDIFYFPSYEIQIDELRDYRFYAKDLLHPSDEAIDYIWGKFRNNCLSDNCSLLTNEIENIVNASEHRIRNPKSEKTKKFAAGNIAKINKLKEGFPYLKFENELKKFYSYLNK